MSAEIIDVQCKIHDTDPYKILGVSKEAGTEFIKDTYKHLLKYVHPDKSALIRTNGKILTNDEKVQLFIKLQLAYKEIRLLRKYSEGNKAPDYQLNYEVEPEFSIATDTGLGEVTMENFNDKFDNMKEFDTKNGFSDPYARGYGFGPGISDYLNNNKSITGGSYNANDIPVAKDPESRPCDTVSTYKEYFEGSSLRGFEYGVTTVSDFTCTSSNITGTDLMQAYKNNEDYEKTVKRDPRIFNKYIAEEDISVRAARYSQDRELDENRIKGLIKEDPSGIDEDIYMQIKEQQEQEAIMEQLRLARMSAEDSYYAIRNLRLKK